MVALINYYTLGSLNVIFSAFDNSMIIKFLMESNIFFN